MAHFVGDFVLQFDKLHALKFKNAGGLLLHILVVIACFAAFCWPYLDRPVLWLFFVFIGITHYAQDWAKIKFTTHLKHGSLFFMLDQILHVLFISMVLFTGLHAVRPPLNINGNFFINLYNNNTIALYLIMVIIASYASHYIILLVKKDYLRIAGTVSRFEKRYGFFERIMIVSAMIAGGLWLLLIPLTLALRPVLFRTIKDKLSVSAYFASRTEIFLSAAASILTGLIFYLLV